MAEAACAGLGAHLVTPRTEQENECAEDVARTYSQWLGYRGGRTEESFIGADGCGPITYSNWDANQPILYAVVLNCAFIGGEGLWFTIPCSLLNKFALCQLKAR